MNPLALLGMAAVGLGLFFLSGKGGGGGNAEPDPPHVDPKPHPEPTADCSATINAIDGLEQDVLDALNEEPIDPAKVCASYNTYMMAVQAAQSGPCANEIPATNIPTEIAAQCSAPAQCQALLIAVAHDAAVLIELYQKDPSAQGDLCNAKKQLDTSVAAAQAAGCQVTLPSETPNFQCDSPPYVPPGTDCTAEFAAYQAAVQNAQYSVSAWESNQTSAAMACAAVTAWQAATSALVAKGCEVPSGYMGPANGDPCSQPTPGKVDPQCSAALQDFITKFDAYSAAMAGQGTDAACPLEPGVQAAYDSAIAAGCNLTGYGRPDNCQTWNKNQGGGGQDPQCPGFLAQLVRYRDGQWSSDPATYCTQVNEYNGFVDAYQQVCGNPEGWQKMDSNAACSGSLVQGWGYWR